MPGQVAVTARNGDGGALERIENLSGAVHCACAGSRLSDREAAHDRQHGSPQSHREECFKRYGRTA
jgi:hypothetical protein